MTEFQKNVIELINEGKPVSVVAKELEKPMSSAFTVVKKF